jgi:hypothetical protein
MLCRCFHAWLWLTLLLSPAPLSAVEPPVDFNRQVQPLLSDRCYKCHGPDAAQRQADLRLDEKQSAFAEREGVRAVVPGDAKASALVERIFSADPDERMPPADSKLTLSAAEKALLRRWVEEGRTGPGIGPSLRHSGPRCRKCEMKIGRRTPLIISCSSGSKRKTCRPRPKPIAARSFGE